MRNEMKSASGGEKYAAIILAAGKGTRMNEGTASPIPKVMFEIAGKPIIDYSVKLIKDAGIEMIVLVVGYKKEMVMDYLGDKVKYVTQEQQLGTGHAASMAKDSLLGKAEAVLIFGGDSPLFKPETVNKLMSTFDREKPAIAMLTVISSDPTGYGRVFRDEKGYVTSIVEHKDCNPEQLKNKEWNPAFYIFDAAWLWENIVKLNSENAQNELYLTDMIYLACEQGKKIIAVPVSEENEAFGINTQEQLKEAEQILQARQN